MPRKSVKNDKNIFFQSRENAHLTREIASERIEFLSDDRIERIESDKSEPHPDEVLAMAECYNDPLLINKFCTELCPIGKKHVTKITDSELATIVLTIMDSVNNLSESKDRLISISVDGIISDDEREDFNAILKQLERISTASDTLKFWLEKQLDFYSDSETSK